MKNEEMLWNKFVMSGSVDDYLKYCSEKTGKETADEHGWLDNQGKKHGRAKQNGNGAHT